MEGKSIITATGTIAFIILLFALGVFTGYQFAKPSYSVRIDTVVKTVEVPTIEIKKLKGLTVFRTDSIHDTIVKDPTVKEIKIHDTVYYAVKPYIQLFDTTVSTGKFKGSYFFPEMVLKNITIIPNSVKDSSYNETRIINRPLWLDLTTHGAVATIVYLLIPKGR